MRGKSSAVHCPIRTASISGAWEGNNPRDARMEKARLPDGAGRSGRSALGGEHPCGPAHAAMTAAATRAPSCQRCTGFAARRPGPHAGQAAVVEDATGRGPPRAAGGGGQARRDRDAERTSGRAFSQQGRTATGTDRVCRVPPRHEEGEGLAHAPVGARKVGADPPPWCVTSGRDTGTPSTGQGALGTWQLQESLDLGGLGNKGAPWEANQSAPGGRWISA
jgi:hypothetical protein